MIDIWHCAAPCSALIGPTLCSLYIMLPPNRIPQFCHWYLLNTQYYEKVPTGGICSLKVTPTVFTIKFHVKPQYIHYVISLEMLYSRTFRPSMVGSLVRSLNSPINGFLTEVQKQKLLGLLGLLLLLSCVPQYRCQYFGTPYNLAFTPVLYWGPALAGYHSDYRTSNCQ